LLAPLRGNVDLLGLVHVADVPGRHAPGTGVIDYPAIYRGLRREGYRGWMAMEFLPTDDAAAELRKAAAETVVPGKRVLN
jgi:hydroxypyruvate isomerase